MNVDTLEWPMFMLANIDADFVVESPLELADAVRAGGCAVRSIGTGRVTCGHAATVWGTLRSDNAPGIRCPTRQRRTHAGVTRVPRLAQGRATAPGA